MNGNVGFADIVSIASGEVWEIKPENLEALAGKEAAHYVKFAKSTFGKPWKAGSSYYSASKNGLVFYYKAGGIQVELIAEQRGPGAVVYFWQINGKKVNIKDIVRKAIYLVVLRQYFVSSSPPQRLPNVKPAPNDLPPGKFRPPVIQTDFVLPAILETTRGTSFLSDLLEMVRTCKCPLMMDGSAVAVALDIGTYKRTVGEQVISEKSKLFEVKQDPTVNLYRQTLLVFQLAAASAPVVLALAYGGHWAIRGAIGIAKSSMIVARLVFSTGPPPQTATGLLQTLGASMFPIASSLHVADGASMLVFISPNASSSEPNTAVSLSAKATLMKQLLPVEAQGITPGEGITIDGVDCVVIALIGPG